jgi:hypothetical protein
MSAPLFVNGGGPGTQLCNGAPCEMIAKQLQTSKIDVSWLIDVRRRTVVEWVWHQWQRIGFFVS